MNITGAELIIRFLETRSQTRHDAERVAVIPGGTPLRPLQQALMTSRLERSPLQEADVIFFDYATSIRRMAPVLAQAHTDRQPLVVIASQVRRNLIGTDACQPAEVRRTLDAVTTHSFHVGAAMELLELLPQAFRLAHSGWRGPVLLEIPEDVLTEVMEGAWIPQSPSSSRTRSQPQSQSFMQECYA